MSDLERFDHSLELLRERDVHAAGCDFCQAAKVQQFWDHREIKALRGYVAALEANLARQREAGPHVDRLTAARMHG